MSHRVGHDWSDLAAAASMSLLVNGCQDKKRGVFDSRLWAFKKIFLQRYNFNSNALNYIVLKKY